MTNWDRRFLDLALHIAAWSKDRSTQVGAVVVGPDREIIATGYNGLPRGLNDAVEERHVRPEKYLWAEHAERNAIYNAARIGVSVKGATLYLASTPVKFPPCMDCARAVIQSGIARLVQAMPEGEYDRWKESCEKAVGMLREAGVSWEAIL